MRAIEEVWKDRRLNMTFEQEMIGLMLKEGQE
jgi:hypothetical protein